jgi:hypothetical protein
LQAIIEHSQHPGTGPGGTPAASTQYDAKSSPVLVSIEDPAMRSNSSAVMILSQQLDLVRMCSEVATKSRQSLPR